MNKKNHKNGMNRREFLQTGAKLAGSAMFMGLGTSKVFGAANAGPMATSIETITLNNGVDMPILGFGTLYLDDELGIRCVADAISLGYRLIDTATIYGNEEAVGGGIKRSGIDREELFVTSKLWVDDSGYESTKKAFQTSLNKLGLDYLDLYLIHRPRGDVNGTWRAMEELYKDGLIKAIGVSNFTAEQITDLMDNFSVTPAVNQIETHAFFMQPDDLKFLNDHNIQHEAWSPLAQGRNGHFTNETLAEIGKKYGKSNAQVALRWHYQRGIVAIPRSSQKAHMAENVNIFDFELDESDMQAIAALDLNKTQFPEWE
ncbi:MAG: aldo/keto reductase [Balneolaceae bacterium]|nr:aldo/keto reductase [Balneolaceae bacterium]